MRVVDVLIEAPIDGADYRDARLKGDKTRSFTDLEGRKAESPRWRGALEGRWKDPHKFYLVFVEAGEEYFFAQAGEKDLKSPLLRGWAKHANWGIPVDGDMELMAQFAGLGIKFRPDCINAVYVGNDVIPDSHGGPSQHAMSPWILAHRLGHAMQGEIDASGWRTAAERQAKLLSSGESPLFDVVSRYGTFKSAPRMNDVGEEGPEIFAQKVVTGRFRLRGSEGGGPLAKIERLCNSGIDETLDASVGRVFTA